MPIFPLKIVPNLKIVKVNFEVIVRNTSIAKVWQNLSKKEGHYLNNISNAVRLVLLYKFGGTYFDTDIVSLNSLPEDKSNFAIYENDLGGVNNALIKFEKKHPLLAKMLDNLALDFKPKEWAYNGPKLFGRTLEQMCSYEKDQGWKCDKKLRMSFLPISTAYPINWKYKERFFSDWPFHFDSKTFALHYFYHMLAIVCSIAKWDEQQALYRVFKQNCPVTEEKFLRKELLGKFIYRTA